MTGQCTIVRIQSLFDEKNEMKDPERRIQPTEKNCTHENITKISLYKKFKIINLLRLWNGHLHKKYNCKEIPLYNKLETEEQLTKTIRRRERRRKLGS